MSHEVCRNSSPIRKSVKGQNDIWKWHELEAPEWRETLENANEDIIRTGYHCPYFKKKELARIPLAIWLFMTGFVFMYTCGRLITVFGRRICE
jgi:hypothetical protein